MGRVGGTRVNEQIDVERSVRSRLRLLDHRARTRSIGRSNADRAQGTLCSHRGRKYRRGYSSHWGLNEGDRQA